MNRFAPEMAFDPMVTADDVTNQKPAPDGLHLIQQQYPGKHIWYLGDTVDDALSAKAAGVPFIGVAAPSIHVIRNWSDCLKEHGAFAVIERHQRTAGLMSRHK